MIYLIRKVPIRHENYKLMLKVVPVIYRYLSVSIRADSTSYFTSPSAAPVSFSYEDTRPYINMKKFVNSFTEKMLFAHVYHAFGQRSFIAMSKMSARRMYSGRISAHPGSMMGRSRSSRVAVKSQSEILPLTSFGPS